MPRNILHTHTQDEAVAHAAAAVLVGSGHKVYRMWYALDMFWATDDEYCISYQ